MELIIYDNFSKEVNSTKQPTGGTTVNVVMKENTSILNPVFMIDGVNLNANYCKFNNRYYFINDIVLNNNNIYELHCTIDTLATWKSPILSSDQYVLRSASAHDPYIIDSYYPSKASSHFNDHDFGDLRNAPLAGMNITAVVGVIGKSTTSGVTLGAVNYYAMSLGTCKGLVEALLNDSDYLQIGGDLDTGIQKALVNPISYIASITLVPLSVLAFVGDSNTTNSIPLGWWEVSLGFGGLAYLIDPVDVRKTTINHTFDLPQHPDIDSRGAKYLNYSQYSQHSLYLEPYGMIPIDSELLSIDSDADYTTQLHITEIIDVITGISTLRIENTSLLGSKNIAYSTGQLGVPIQLAQMNTDRIEQQKIDIRNRTGAIGGIVSTLSALASGNLAGATTSATGAIASVQTGILDAERASYPTMERSGATGSIASWYVTPHFYSVFSKLADIDITHLGRPLCKKVTLSTLSGYCMTRDAELNIAGLRDEVEIIKSLMNGGFYIE